MISIKNLAFSYRKQKVFQGLNLDLEAGQICGLFGRNGVGKTTLLCNIAGLLFPTKGEINVLGHIPANRNIKLLQEIFFIPDEVYLPNMSIHNYEKNMAPFYPKFRSEQFESFLSRFEVAAGSQLSRLSYGERKKVFISFALAANTSLVLMDEPTNGLDIMAKSQFKKIMATSIDDTRCFIISTHQAKDLENLVDNVVILDNQKVLFNQPIQKISERLQFKTSNNQEEKEHAFYREENMLGNVLVLPNEENKESSVDLELLYKAVITNSEKVNNWFN